jgi:predicted RNA-binding protein with PIN domain
MRFLIDGYNLLHALGLATRQMTGKGLERARFKMLDWLGERRQESESICVVFDAQNSRRADQLKQHYRGIELLFAYRETADDRIEEMLQVEKQPRTLIVVSNDTRLQTAARRKGSLPWSSDQFVDWLIRERPNPNPKPPPSEEKIEAASESEMEEWLQAFQLEKPRKN